MNNARFWGAIGSAMVVLLTPGQAAAQDEEGPRRTRVGLGVQLVPSFPGSGEASVRPLFDLARTRGDRPYEFEAPDESFGFPVLRAGKFAFGPAIGFEGERDAADVGANLPDVDFTFEVGGFVQYSLSDALRARIEVRKGLGGHDGLIGTLGFDFIQRDGNDWLISVGPRLTLADDNYNAAYFSVASQDAAASGLPAYTAEGGAQAVGMVIGYTRQLSSRWGIYSYAKYDRLIGDAAESPIVRQLGSRDQFSGGLAVTYTFGRRAERD